MAFRRTGNKSPLLQRPKPIDFVAEITDLIDLCESDRASDRSHGFLQFCRIALDQGERNIFKDLALDTNVSTQIIFKKAIQVHNEHVVDESSQVRLEAYRSLTILYQR